MPAECDIAACGVLAVGRCGNCGRAFCKSHQSRDFNVAYVDQCSACLAVAQAESEARRPVNSSFFTDGQARAMLLKAGVPTVELHTMGWVQEKGLFRSRYVETAVPYCRGWLLGEIAWDCSVVRGGMASETVPRLTALVDVEEAIPYSHYMCDQMCRVEPDEQHAGYKIIQHDSCRIDYNCTYKQAFLRIREMAGKGGIDGAAAD